MTDSHDTAYPVLSEEADAEYELESEEGSLWTGTRLLMGVWAMAWAAVAFAYFYLRALDVGPAWRSPHVMPSPLLGTLIGGCVLLGAIMISYGSYKFRQGLGFEWNLAAWLCAGLGGVAGAGQIWQLTRLHFFPGQSGYTSVFIGFAALNVVFILGGAIWAEMLAARTLRLAREVGPHEYLGATVKPEVRIFRASISGCVYFWWFMSAISLLFYILFYILP